MSKAIGLFFAFVITMLFLAAFHAAILPMIAGLPPLVAFIVGEFLMGIVAIIAYIWILSEPDTTSDRPDFKYDPVLANYLAISIPAHIITALLELLPDAITQVQPYLYKIQLYGGSEDDLTAIQRRLERFNGRYWSGVHCVLGGKPGDQWMYFQLLAAPGVKLATPPEPPYLDWRAELAAMFDGVEINLIDSADVLDVGYKVNQYDKRELDALADFNARHRTAYGSFDQWRQDWHSQRKPNS